MEATKEDPVAKVADLEKQFNALKWAAYKGIAVGVAKVTLKSYAYLAVFMLTSAILLKPVWLACKWLWNLY